MDITEPISRLRDGALETATRRHERMMAEARRIIDAGNASGVVLRLTGGLAVRHYAIDLDFAEREYSDIDLVGLLREAVGIIALFSDLGYQENLHVAQATSLAQRQFFRLPPPLASRAHMAKRMRVSPVLTSVPPADHIDVFLDAMRMDHVLDLRDRLDINSYAIDPADLLLSKLQIVNLTEKDAHDVITLCKDVYVDFEPRPGVLDLEHIAATCASDWGLYVDVMANIELVLEILPDYGLSRVESERVRRTLTLAQDMTTEHTKTLRWRLRARVGKRIRWYSEVDERAGGRTEETAAAVRTKAGRPLRQSPADDEG